MNRFICLGLYIIFLFVLASCSDYDDKKNTLPDLSQWSYVKTLNKDMLPQISGKETIIKILERTKNGHKETLHIYQFGNGKIFAFGFLDHATAKETIFWDIENDGDFEHEGATGKINFNVYGQMLPQEDQLPDLGNITSNLKSKQGLPDMKNWVLINTFNKDFIPQIPDEETTVKIYQGQKQNNQKSMQILEFPNGEVYGFAIIDNTTGKRELFWDYDNNGNFEEGPAVAKIKKEAYGY